MRILGAELVHVAEGEVHVALSSRPELCQENGHVHGGALTSILDSACSCAAMTVAPPGVGALTVEFKIKLIRPAAPADRFVAIANVTKAGEALTLCRAELFTQLGSEREAIAVMQATISNVPGNA
jgi:uncharacterized protein (TIGR00369 family)